MGKLNHYANNTPDGTYHAYCWEFYQGIDYGHGRMRDLVVFAIVNEKRQLIKGADSQPMFAVCVCNNTKQKSAKAKINKLKRALISKRHGISELQSYKSLPDIKSFCDDESLNHEPYSIKVENKTVNGKTVSNITHIFSYLANNYVDIRGVFDKR